MKRILALAFFILVVGATKASAAQAGFLDLNDVSDSKQLKLELAFDKTPKTLINYYEKSIQLDVQDGHVSPAKRVFDINRDNVKSVNVYQVSPQLMRVRIFPEEGKMQALKDSFSLTPKGAQLILGFGGKPKVFNSATAKASDILTQEKKIASKTTPPAEANKPEKAEAEETVKEAKAETVTEDTNTSSDNFMANIQKSLDDLKAEDAKNENKNQEKRSESQPNAKMAAFAPAEAAVAAQQAPGLGEAFIKMGSALFVVLALIFIVSFGVKKYMGTAENMLGTKKQLKVLSNHFIGVKKNVTIIEIAGEILVLGVTNNNISLLAQYSDPEKIESIRFAHRLPDKPMGIFKKFKLFNWEGKKNAVPSANSQFARQVASYAEEASYGATQKNSGTFETAGEEAVAGVARAIKERLRAIERTA